MGALQGRGGAGPGAARLFKPPTLAPKKEATEIKKTLLGHSRSAAVSRKG